jgi:hypothetical protein
VKTLIDNKIIDFQDDENEKIKESFLKVLNPKILRLYD